jgi:hypothetical protein
MAGKSEILSPVFQSQVFFLVPKTHLGTVKAFRKRAPFEEKNKEGFVIVIFSALRNGDGHFLEFVSLTL